MIATLSAPASQPLPHLGEVGKLTEAEIERLRADLRLTAEREGWDETGMREIGAAIKAAIDAGDLELQRYWQRELGWWRELLASFAPRLRAFEAGIRSERERRVA